MKKPSKQPLPPPQHPVQPLVVDEHGTIRFKGNAIVRFLLDTSVNDLNKLYCMPFSREDWVQFNQLIGYSVCGWSDLSCVNDDDYARATKENYQQLQDTL